MSAADLSRRSGGVDPSSGGVELPDDALIAGREIARYFAGMFPEWTDGQIRAATSDLLAISDRRAARVRAEAVADERQRIAEDIGELPLLFAHGGAWFPKSPEQVRSDAAKIAAGSVPVATRRHDQCDETCTVDCGHCKGQGRPVATPPTCEAYPRDGRVHSTPATGTAITVHADPVATPTEPAQQHHGGVPDVCSDPRPAEQPGER